jgi:hypothetical protein
MSKSRFSAFVYVLVVFLSGALLGALAQRLYSVNSVVSGSPAAKKADPEEVRKHIIGEMRDRLKLDDQQVGKLEQIMDHTREEFKQLHDRMNAEGHGLRDHQVTEITEMLRPEQRPLYEQYRKDREAERKRRQAAEKK